MQRFYQNEIGRSMIGSSWLLLTSTKRWPAFDCYSCVHEVIQYLKHFSRISKVSSSSSRDGATKHGIEPRTSKEIDTALAARDITPREPPAELFSTTSDHAQHFVASD